MSEVDLEVGSSVPDFKLSDQRGKKIVLFFVREYN
jgi:peroxiredoxin